VSKRLLGLPLTSPRATLVASLALFAYYAATMCRGLSMYDSPELALVAEQFGLGHPFGQPLHTFIGGLLSRLPGVDPLIALNGLSALAGALTVIPATSFAEALLRPDPDCPDGDARLVAPTVALLGVHPALWEPATRIEVYPLAAFFALWAAASVAHALLEGDERRRPYFGTGLALGLSASVNVICALSVALAMSPALLIAELRKEIPRKSVWWIALGGVLGLCAYGYVFAVAGRTDVFVWGAPTDAAALGHYFSGADFNYKGVSSWSEWIDHVGQLLTWSLSNGLLGIWIVGFAGYALFARGRGLGRFFYTATWLLFVAFIARNGVFATDLLDYAGYLAIPTWLAAAGAGLLVAYLAGRNAWSAVAALCALVLLVLVASPGPYERTRHLDSFTEDVAEAALLAAPDNAILIVAHDHWVAPMLYLQERRAVRPDVVVLAYGLSSSSWYWDLIYHRHPGLTSIELRAPGGRDARVRRFLQANAERPIQVERFALAARIGLRVCPSDWLLDSRARCPQLEGEPALARACAAALSELGDGSPGTAGLIALMTLQRGHDLFSLGLPRAAVATLLSGVPQVVWDSELDLSSVPTRISRANHPEPTYSPRVALGHPAQNLHYAAFIARMTGAPQVGHYLERLAAAVGPVTPKFAASRASPDSL
jgi:hypothetical protein